MRFLPSYFSVASLVLWSCLTAAALGANLQVIANPSVRASVVSSEELKGVFLATRTALSDGSHVNPVLLKSGVVHEIFVRQYVGKSNSALETYYRSLLFTGKGLIPKSLGSEKQVVQYVAKTKGAVGYVSTDTPISGVKVLDVR